MGASWLDILHRYLICKRNDKTAAGCHLSALSPTRCHTRPGSRRAGEGAGRTLSHSTLGRLGQDQLDCLGSSLPSRTYDAQHNKLFDSVLVVNDRTVLDAQLQEAIFDFERTTGVVASITNEQGSKSAQLGQALKDGKESHRLHHPDLPFALQAVQDLAATEGKRFAVIADEAHSSQTGGRRPNSSNCCRHRNGPSCRTGARWTPKRCWPLRWKACWREGADLRGFHRHAEGEDVKLFGRKGCRRLAAALPRLLDAPNHRRGFILDVLRNYTSYKLAFKLARRAGSGTTNRSSAALR